MLITHRDEFEPIWSSLIHSSLFPTLDTVIKDLISEEDHLDTLRDKHTPPSTDVVLGVHVSPKFVLVQLFRILLGHLGRTSAITARIMVILSLSVADYSLSNLPARTLHSTLFELLLLLLLKSHLEVPLLNFS